VNERTKIYATLAENFARLARLEQEASPSEWVDQAASPLGRRAHLKLAKTGKVPVARFGRKVLIRKSDLDAFLMKASAVELSEDDRAEQLARSWRKTA
jgi:excisionase family DNA binding protein